VTARERSKYSQHKKHKKQRVDDRGFYAYSIGFEGLCVFCVQWLKLQNSILYCKNNLLTAAETPD
jgi:hypothetical protein